MKIFENLIPYRVIERPCVFTFGNFDGVHLGHQYIFRQVIDQAHAQNLSSAILTFRNHPAEILRPDKAPSRLTSPEKKLELIESFGFDIVIDLAFTKEIAELSADDFFNKLLIMLPIACFVVGDDVAFGKDRVGNKEYLVAKSEALGFKVKILEKFCVDGLVVSSTLVRKLIQEGEFEKVSALLGRPYVGKDEG